MLMWELGLIEIAALAGLITLVTLGVRQTWANRKNTKITEEWTDNYKPGDESVKFETQTRGIALIIAKTIGELAGKHKLSKLGLSVNQQADNKVKVVLFGAGKNVEEFIQEVKDIL